MTSHNFLLLLAAFFVVIEIGGLPGVLGTAPAPVRQAQQVLAWVARAAMLVASIQFIFTHLG